MSKKISRHTILVSGARPTNNESKLKYAWKMSFMEGTTTIFCGWLKIWFSGQFSSFKKRFLVWNARESKKFITAEKCFVKIKIVDIYFMRLFGYLDMFRKSQKVSARKFDSKGVKHDTGFWSPPRMTGLKPLKMKF